MMASVSPKTRTPADSQSMLGLSTTCKICSQTFSTLQDCLKHEISHAAKVSKKRGKKRRHIPETRQQKRQEAAESDNDFREMVIKALTRCPPEHELNLLCQLFQPNPKDLEFIYNRIFDDLTNIVMPLGDYEVLSFGSINTGVFLKSSDMDFYVQQHPNSTRSKPLPKTTYNKLARALHLSPEFEQINEIRGARIPIIKCVHKLSGFELDINTTSPFGVYNSHFMAKITKSDNRIFLLMLILKIWGKSWDLIKVGRFSNYSLTLLLIFYLQNVKPAIIPPIRRLHQQAHTFIIVDGVDFSINEAHLHPEKNTLNIRQLLQGFFEFYLSFDFQNELISPYLGKAIKKSEFVANKFPEYEKQLCYFRDNDTESKKRRDITTEPLAVLDYLVVVQDPFCLNQIVSKSVNEAVLHLFKERISQGRWHCADQSIRPNILLLKLFYGDNLQPGNLKMPSPTTNTPVRPQPVAGKSTTLSSCICRLSPLEAELFQVRNYFRKTYPDRETTTVAINQYWTEKCAEFLRQVLREIYKVQVIEENLPSPPKSNKSDGQNDVHLTQYEIRADIRSNLDLWSGRKYKMTSLQEQIELSEKLEEARKKSAEHAIDLHCRLTLKPENDFTAIVVNLENLGGKPTRFKVFFTDLTTRMRPLLRLYFDRLMKGDK